MSGMFFCDGCRTRPSPRSGQALKRREASQRDAQARNAAAAEFARRAAFDSVEDVEE